MEDWTREPGSFRDPGGAVYYSSDKVFRTVSPEAVEDFEQVRATGLLEKLVAQNQLIGGTVANQEAPPQLQPRPALILEHPRIPFISYPYEWCFYALRDAAIHQLQTGLSALEYDVMLSDASAYNIQFIGASPIFIDHLSFRTYEQGKAWKAHRQYCDQFLNPLLLRALLGIPHNAWYRGNLEGIPTTELNRLIPTSKKFSAGVFFHVTLQAMLQNAANKKKNRRQEAKTVSLDKRKIIYIMESLNKYVKKLTPKRIPDSVWHQYAWDNSYADEEEQLKRQFIVDFVTKVRPGLLLDLGCNTGEYSMLALKSGAELAVGMDTDHPALEQGYLRAKEKRLNFLPLYFDIANPSPNQGWNCTERRGLQERANADAVFALALLHHLVFGRNIPLDMAVAQLIALAPAGVIEFVPKTDPMVQDLLLLRKDIFPNYTQNDFEACLKRCSGIVKSEQVNRFGRRLYWYA